mgnify:FL=1|tara:strand:+ start:1019 stop:1873 length:855 start_codon:yes stop_codon:yes gene_type:complete
MQIKHSKYKNTGILFELLIRQITTDTLEGNSSFAKEILQKYFVKSELGKEYKLYESLLKRSTLTEAKASITISTLVESSKHLNRGAIKRQKYNLINEIKKHYDLTHFFNHSLPNYKPFAAFYTLLELNNSPISNPNQLIQNKITILEHLTVPSIKKNKVIDEVMEEVNKCDKDTKLLTYKILMDKFNGKYDDLATNQKLILKEYINSIDNAPRLKEFYAGKINEIRENLKDLNNSTQNQVTKIKINEIISLINVPPKNYKLKDKDLVDLLQYCDLLEELEIANG